MIYGVLLSVVAAFCWGSTSLLMRGMTHLGPLDMTLGRSVGAFAVTFIIAFFSGTLGCLFTFTASEWSALTLLVLANNIFGDVALFLALHSLGVAYGSSISSTYPIVVALMSIFFFGESFSYSILSGTLLVVAGVACLCQRGNAQGKLSTKGLLLAVLASILWGIGLSMNKYLVLHELPASSIAFGRSFLFVLITAAYWLFKNISAKTLAKAWRQVAQREIFLALAGGVLAIGFGGFLYARALQFVPATVATPIGASNPLLATFAAMFIYKEKLRIVQWIGVFMVVAGTVIVAF